MFRSFRDPGQKHKANKCQDDHGAKRQGRAALRRARVGRAIQEGHQGQHHEGREAHPQEATNAHPVLDSEEGKERPRGFRHLDALDGGRPNYRGGDDGAG